MLSPHAPNPEREPLAKLMAEYERSHTVETTPILVRDNAKASLLSTGIRNVKGKAPG